MTVWLTNAQHQTPALEPAATLAVQRRRLRASHLSCSLLLASQRGRAIYSARAARLLGLLASTQLANLCHQVNNTESSQFCPVFLWEIYRVGKSGFDTARNTYRYNPDVQKFRSHVRWKNHNLFATHLGLREEVAELTVKKLQDSGRRFPTFWPPTTTGAAPA